jgi:hypothetical protein
MKVIIENKINIDISKERNKDEKNRESDKNVNLQAKPLTTKNTIGMGKEIKYQIKIMNNEKQITDVPVPKGYYTSRQIHNDHVLNSRNYNLYQGDYTNYLMTKRVNRIYSTKIKLNKKQNNFLNKLNGKQLF